MSSVIALAGSPNSGKSALFNALTGGKQKVANYPGATVEKKFGRLRTVNGLEVMIIDLPGTYSLNPKSPDEQIAVDVLNDRCNDADRADAIIVVADATNLRRTMSLALEMRQVGKPMILALNMFDVARQRGLDIDIVMLAHEIGMRVVPTAAIKGEGVEGLIQALEGLTGETEKAAPARAAAAAIASGAAEQGRKTTPATAVLRRYEEIDRILAKVVRRVPSPDTMSRRIDRIVLHPFLGSFVLSSVLFLVFQAVFSWAGPLQDGIESSLAWFGVFVGQFIGHDMIRSLVVDGVISGVGAVIVFLPQILILFLFLLALEGSGFMARAALIMDRMMRAMGLQGRAFIPLLSSFACAIPGIMATRTLSHQKDRLLTILVAPLMTCSARLPVYVLIISAFVPATTVWGFVGLQGLVMFGLYAAGVISAIATAWILKQFMFRGPASPFIMELPSYRWPNLRQVMLGMQVRSMIFLKRAGTTILGLSILLWVATNFPKPPPEFAGSAIEYSVAGRIGKSIEPVLEPIGFDWRIGTGLIPGFAAREVMVAALATVFALEDAGDEEAQATALSERMQQVWGLPTALALLVWYVFSPQCLSTFVVARRETNGWKWPVFMFTYMLALAYGAAFVVYQIAKLFTA